MIYFASQRSVWLDGSCWYDHFEMWKLHVFANEEANPFDQIAAGVT